MNPKSTVGFLLFLMAFGVLVYVYDGRIPIFLIKQVRISAPSAAVQMRTRKASHSQNHTFCISCKLTVLSLPQPLKSSSQSKKLTAILLSPQQPPLQTITNTTETPPIEIDLVLGQGEDADIDQGRDYDYDDDNDSAEGEEQGRRIHSHGEVR